MNCFNCRHEINACSNMCDGMDMKPKDGDFNICLYCGDLSVFENDIIRKLTESDIDNMGPEFLYELQIHQKVLSSVREQMHKWGD